MVLARHRRHAALERAGGGEGAGIVARLECAHHARQSVDRLWIKWVLHGRHSLVFERRNRLDDFIAKLDGADALIASLNAGRLALDVDLKPNAANAGGLHREAAGLAGNAGVSRVAANDRVERAMAANLLVDHDVEVDVALWLKSSLHHVLDGHDVAGDAALHIARATAVEFAILDQRRPRIVAPAFAIADGNDVGMAIEQ